MPGKDARRTALIQVKIVALAPMPKAKVVTTTKVKPGLLNRVRSLDRKSCQKVSTIRLFLLSTSIESANNLANGSLASDQNNLRNSQHKHTSGNYSSASTRPAPYF